MFRPVRIISIARALPIARVSRCVPPAPGMTPSLISGWPNCASSPATIMSHVIASSQPPPSAKPRTAATSGVRTRLMRSQRWKWSSIVRLVGVCAASSGMSAPAANARSPAPVMTIARQRGSRSSASSASVSSAMRREVERVEHLVTVEDDERDAVDRAVGALRRQRDVEGRVGGRVGCRHGVATVSIAGIPPT